MSTNCLWGKYYFASSFLKVEGYESCSKTYQP